MPWQARTISTRTITKSNLGLTGVTAIRVRVVCNQDAGGNPSSTGTSSIYEIDATGQVYGDIGLRVRKGSTNVAIGADALTAAHKLRIRKGGVTYGIPLLSVSDTDASTVRINDGASVKALPKAT